jgi:hypothetical protein
MKLQAVLIKRIVALTASLCLAGCAYVPSLSKPVDLVAAQKVTVKAKSGPKLEVAAPSVTVNEEVTSISGAVKRKPNVDGSIEGFLLLSISSKQGELLDELAMAWIPRDIPTTGDRSAQYSANLGWTVPEGAIIEVAYVEKVSEAYGGQPNGSGRPGGSGAGASSGGSSQAISHSAAPGGRTSRGSSSIGVGGHGGRR